MEHLAGSAAAPAKKLCRVVQPGALSTVQDRGRWGFQRVGMSPGGVMDSQAYGAANWLLGNDPEAAVLEMTLLGATLEFLEQGRIALTGADMGAKLNGEAAPRYAAFSVGPGEVLQLGFAASGCRGYLAVAGGWAVPEVMGSRSTNLKCKLGGLEGRALRPGDELAAYAYAKPSAGELRQLMPPQFEREFRLRFVAGPQADRFTAAALAAFCSEAYTVSAQSDRMGCRLEGPALEPSDRERGMDIVSDGIAFGAIQISNQGQPIVLMADRQTTGGYAKIGTVISADLPKLAQAMPGAVVHFAQVDIAEAQAALRAQRAEMNI